VHEAGGQARLADQHLPRRLFAERGVRRHPLEHHELAEAGVSDLLAEQHLGHASAGQPMQQLVPPQLLAAHSVGSRVDGARYRAVSSRRNGAAHALASHLGVERSRIEAGVERLPHRSRRRPFPHRSRVAPQTGRGWRVGPRPSRRDFRHFDRHQRVNQGTGGPRTVSLSPG
jgi:hypothetical protein